MVVAIWIYKRDKPIFGFKKITETKDAINLFKNLAKVVASPLKYFDRFLIRRDNVYTVVSGIYFLGRKVKTLRREGQIPAHVFGKKIKTEHVQVAEGEFTKVFEKAGETGIIDLHVSEEELAKRKAEWKKPEPNYTTGALAKYATLVGSAAQGAITSANP